MEGTLHGSKGERKTSTQVLTLLYIQWYPAFKMCEYNGVTQRTNEQISGRISEPFQEMEPIPYTA